MKKNISQQTFICKPIVHKKAKIINDSLPDANFEIAGDGSKTT
ncbi:MAG: hypothetical protein R6U84_09220 [Candidatus Cloacimonadales bacterium]